MATTNDEQQHDQPILPDVLYDPLGAMFSDLLGAEDSQSSAQDQQPPLVEEGPESTAFPDPVEFAASREMEMAPASPPQVEAILTALLSELPDEPISVLPDEPSPEPVPEMDSEALTISAGELVLEDHVAAETPGIIYAVTFEPEPVAASIPTVLAEPVEDAPPAAVVDIEPSEAVPETAAEPIGPAESLSEFNGLETLVAELDQENQPVLNDDMFVEPSSGPAAQPDSCIVFLLAETRYAIPIRNVLEMDAVPHITAVPNVPGFVRGVTNLRGEIVVVLDLRTLLRLAPAETAERGRILIVRTKDQQTAALAVDEVRGTTGLALAKLAQPSSPIHDTVTPLLLGVGEHQNHVLNVLDVDKLFGTPELQQFVVN
jgi:purine-binding chemotaxis protein CheW